MQRVLITSGALGLGTALVFGAAALTATVFPNGATVGANMNGGFVQNGMMGKPMIQPAFGGPAPAIAVPAPPIIISAPGVVVDDGSGNLPPDATPEPSQGG
ncbi:MAG TPA: hypothetical protein VGM28_03945 [Candidatus Limnocylindrales bacterium]|jgi:hypothetical protein